MCRGQYRVEEGGLFLEEGVAQLYLFPQHAILFGVADKFVADDDFMVLLFFGLEEVVLDVLFALALHGPAGEGGMRLFFAILGRVVRPRFF